MRQVGGWVDDTPVVNSITKFCQQCVFWWAFFFLQTWDELSNRRAASIIFNQLLGYTSAVHDEVVLENLINPSGRDSIQQGFLKSLPGTATWDGLRNEWQWIITFSMMKVIGINMSISGWIPDSFSIGISPEGSWKVMAIVHYRPLNGVRNMVIEAYVAFPCRKYSIGIGWHNEQQQQQKSLLIHSVDFCRIA